MTDLALEKGLPQNLEAERMVLGALLTGEDFGLVRGAVDSDDFSVEKHRRIYSRMSELHERGERIDIVAVANELNKHGQLESVDGVTYLSGISDIPALMNLEGWVRIIQEKSTLRRGAMACQSLMDRFLLANEATPELLSDADRVIRELIARTANKGNLESAAETLDAMNLNSIGKVPAGVLRTPYGALNRRIVGMFPGEMHVIGARPSAGKSVQAVETALCVAESGRTVALFSLEMRKQALLMRAACNRGQVDNAKVRHGRMNDVERYALVAALSAIRELPLYIDDKAHTFAAMAREVRKMRVKPKLMVVDHLHLMRSAGRHENRNNELAGITRDLKLFAGEMDMAILLLAQLSRASEKENRPPEMRDLRDCGSIESDADVILFLHRKEQMSSGDSKAPVSVDMLLAKQREGIAWIKIPMLLAGRFYQLIETEGQPNDESNSPGLF